MSEIRIQKIDGQEFVTYKDYLRLKEEKEKIDQLISSGELSDGYHTFNSLYHQRAILFATIVNMNRDKSWKSKKHSDGKYCFDKEGEWFIVGIDTPKGSYTYHYETDKYWDLFNCEELELGKERDGHTEKDVDRLFSLGDVVGNLKHRIRQLSDECERLQYLYDKTERLEEEKQKLLEEIKILKQSIMQDEWGIIPKLEEENQKLKSDLEQFSEAYKRYRDYEKEELAESCYDLERENQKLKERIKGLEYLGDINEELKEENKNLKEERDELKKTKEAYKETITALQECITDLREIIANG